MPIFFHTQECYISTCFDLRATFTNVKACRFLGKIMVDKQGKRKIFRSCDFSRAKAIPEYFIKNNILSKVGYGVRSLLFKKGGMFYVFLY